MSDSAEDIKRKVAKGLLKTVKKRTERNSLWENFDGIEDEESGELPYVWCLRCKKVLKYDKVKTGTSHLRRHVQICRNNEPSTSATKVTNFFKTSTLTVPAAAKKDITVKCAEFTCKDLRSFEIVSGSGFRELAQSLINIGVKYGQVPASDILPHPTTVSRNIADIAGTLRETVVKPELSDCLNKWGGAVTTDMLSLIHI